MESLCNERKRFGVFIVIAGLCNVLLAKECVMISQCNCTFDDGSGTVDLSPLGNQYNFPLVYHTYASDGYKYSYNPCYPFTEGIDGSCADCAACQYDTANGAHYDIGGAYSANFSFDGQNVSVTYSHTSSGDGVTRTTEVVLVCDPSVETSNVNVSGEVSFRKYQFILTSKYACPIQPEPARKTCEKIDECKCRFSDGSGTVDLSTIGRQGGTPLVQNMSSYDDYLYSYNPCYPFTEGNCVNSAACQYDPGHGLYYGLGDASSADFSFDGQNVNVTYSHTSDANKTRTTSVVLVCDLSVETPNVTFYGEVSLRYYQFVLTSKYACPNQPEPAKKTCEKIDECKCKFSDGSGTVDLSTIGRQDGAPLFKDVAAPDGNLYSYNPCYPFTEDRCDDIAAPPWPKVRQTSPGHTEIGPVGSFISQPQFCHEGGVLTIMFPLVFTRLLFSMVSMARESCCNFRLCQFEANNSLYYKLGDVSSNKFYYDGLNLYSRYTSVTQSITRTSLVRFVCDPSATQPTITTLGEVYTAEYIFTVTSSAACPKKPRVCTKVDNCRCTMSDGSGTVDISRLGAQFGGSLIEDIPGPDKKYEFSFNPCYPFIEGPCVNVSACLLDPQNNKYYDIGEPDVTFSDDGENVVGIYTANDNVRASHVTYVCNSTAQTLTEVLGEISPSVYGFKLTSPDVCPQRDDN